MKNGGTKKKEWTKLDTEKSDRLRKMLQEAFVPIMEKLEKIEQEIEALKKEQHKFKNEQSWWTLNRKDANKFVTRTQKGCVFL